MLLLRYAPPRPVPFTPTYDATGAGFNTSSAVTTAPWSHAATVGAQVLAFFVVASNSITLSAVYGAGNTMTQLGSISDTTAGVNGYLFGYANAPGGPQTLTATPSASAFVGGQSVSYTGVTTVGTPATALFDGGGSGVTTASMSPTCTAGQIIVASFQDFTGVSMTGVTGGNVRSLILNGGTAGHGELSINDAAVSTTFTATFSSADFASGINVVLS